MSALSDRLARVEGAYRRAAERSKRADERWETALRGTDRSAIEAAATDVHGAVEALAAAEEELADVQIEADIARERGQLFARSSDLSRGTKVRVVAGEDSGREGVVESSDGQHVVVVFADGSALRTLASNVEPLSTHDLTEVSVSPDGGVEVCTDPSGDEARAGTFSALCPYCERRTAVVMSRLGEHRVLGGVCDGAGRVVSRLDSAGRAILQALMSIFVELKPGYHADDAASAILTETDYPCKQLSPKALEVQGTDAGRVREALRQHGISFWTVESG